MTARPGGSGDRVSWGRSGWAVDAASARPISIDGPHRLELLLRGRDVAGAMGAFVFTHAPILENPPHAHLGFMKIMYIIEGRYEVRVGDAEFPAGPETTVMVPAGSQHTFTTATGGRALFVCSPAGNEELFLQYEQLGADATAQQIQAVNDRMATIALDTTAGRRLGDPTSTRSVHPNYRQSD